MNSQPPKFFTTITLTLLFGAALFLTMNRHSKSGYFNYHSEIWGDKAGYYIYLPGIVKHHGNAALLPDSIVAKTGEGFKIDSSTNKIKTKYTCGVAIMLLPFYTAADILAPNLGYENDGFSPPYHKTIDIAAVVYLMLGLLLLSKILRKYVDEKAMLFSILTLYAGTNLLYYGIRETGMSHVYLFFLFSAFIYLLQKSNFLSDSKLYSTLLTGIVGAMIILIRPSNIVFVVGAFLFLDLKEGTIPSRIRNVLRLNTAIPLILSALIVFTPQFLYWKDTYGSYIHYAYQGEGFNWLSPQLQHTWFAALNGLFPYTPMFLMIIIGMYLMVKRKINNGIFVSTIFLLISYIFSCWWAPSFGCALGGRSFVEYYALFSIPLAYLGERVLRSNRIIQFSTSLILLIFIGMNLKFTYSLDGCFYGENSWDWSEYAHLLTNL